MSHSLSKTPDSPLGFRYGVDALSVRSQTVPQLLRRQAERWGAGHAVRAGGHVVTFAELPALAACRAAQLASAGVRRGDRVAALCSNRLELLELILGCGWMGAVAAPLNTASRGPQLQHMLSNAEPKLVVVERDLAGALDGVQLDPSPGVWLISEDAHPGGTPAPDAFAADTPVSPPADTFRPWPASSQEQLDPGEVEPGDTFVILYTSGTTGPSKGVCCPHAQLFRFGLTVAEMLEIDERDALYTCLPLFHTNALNCFFQALLSGASYCLDTRFSASRFFDRAIEADASVTYLLGAMAPILLKQPARPQERMHRIRVANGNAPPPEVDRAMRERFGFGIAECYASTEAGCVLGAPISDQRLGWMGRPMPGYEVRVVDAHDVEVADGVPGELLVRADVPHALSSGYHGMPEKTVQAWRNLWLHTGDRVLRDGDGWLKFVDRITDSLRRRGENISSYEVEQVLASHPGVSAATVFGVPSDLGEQEVMAVVVPREGAALTPEKLVEFCVPRLAYFAIPRFIELAGSLPLTDNGKVRKFVLRERGVTDDTWDLERAGITLPRPAR